MLTSVTSMVPWFRANAALLAFALAALTVFCRACWRALGPVVRRRWPRVGHLHDALAAISPDLAIFGRALWRAWTGVPWPEPAAPTVAPVPPRRPPLTTPVPPPVVMLLLALAFGASAPGCGAAQRPQTDAEAIARKGVALAAIVLDALPPPATRDQELVVATARAGLATTERALATDWRCAGGVVVALADTLSGVLAVLRVAAVAVPDWLTPAVSVVRLAGMGLATTCPATVVPLADAGAGDAR